MIISSIVKEHLETSTLGTIYSLMQILIDCANPLVDEEPSMHHSHTCTSCGSLCTFDSHVGDSVDDGLVTDKFLNEIFEI